MNGFFTQGDAGEGIKSSPKTKKSSREKLGEACHRVTFGKKKRDSNTSYEEWRDEVEQLKARCEALEERCQTLEQCVDYKSNCQNCGVHIQRLLTSGDTVCRTTTCCLPFL